MFFSTAARRAVKTGSTRARCSAGPSRVQVKERIVTLPELPGIGFEGKADLYAEMKALVQ